MLVTTPRIPGIGVYEGKDDRFFVECRPNVNLSASQRLLLALYEIMSASVVWLVSVTSKRSQTGVICIVEIVVDVYY